jgi:ubiquinone/menaquinone biosynthesis C-methylase UbiE
LTSADEKSPFVYEADTYQKRRVAHWEDIYIRKHASLGNHYRERLIECYRNLIPEGSLVLEIGCGEGDLLSALNPSVGVGIDFSQRAIERARVAYPALSFYVGDAHGLDLNEGSFDFIVFSDLLNDLWDVQAVLKGIAGNIHVLF